MKEIDGFLQHLKTLTESDWQKLFDLQKEIEQTKTFGEMKGMDKDAEGTLTMPYWEWAEITKRFYDVVHKLELVPAFDWTNWKEGEAILNNNKQNFNELDTVTLCKLFTVMIRADRFNDGVLIMNFENGTILKIIKALQKKQQLN